MKHIIARYLGEYLGLVIGWFLVWLAAIHYLNGIIPVLCGIVWVTIVVVTIPVYMYMDYCTLRDLVLHGVTAYQEPERRTEFFQQVVVTASSQMGIPEFMAEYAVSRVIKKFNL